MEPSPEIEALIERVSRFIREAVPEVEERVYKDGWSRGYSTAKAGSLCGLFPRRGAVYLSFVRGDQLPDPDGLLEGKCHLAFRPGGAFPEERLFELLVAAMLVGAERRRKG